MKMQPTEITIHHSASSFATTFEQINEWHCVKWNFISKFGFYCGYHYVITADGKVHKARQDWEMGAHSIPNDGKIGVCVVGNFMNDEPNDKQLESLTDLLNELKSYHGISKVLGHRDCNKTLCPGDNLYKYVLIDKINWLQKCINFFILKP